MTIRNLRTSVDALKALSHPLRLRMLALLRGGELCVCQITEVLGYAPSTISEHLSQLRRAGFIVERKESKWVFYALTEDTALASLSDALWPVIDDPTLAEDAQKCGRVRQLPLSALCKTAGKGDELAFARQPAAPPTAKGAAR